MIIKYRILWERPQYSPPSPGAINSREVTLRSHVYPALGQEYAIFVADLNAAECRPRVSEIRDALAVGVAERGKPSMQWRVLFADEYKRLDTAIHALITAPFIPEEPPPTPENWDVCRYCGSRPEDRIIVRRGDNLLKNHCHECGAPTYPVKRG